jgi:hypothetical protein
MATKTELLISTGLGLIVGALLLAVMHALSGCSALQPPTGPNTEYPCGVNGVQCSGHMCCGENFVCGGDDPTCPKGACCYVGEDITGARGPQRPERAMNDTMTNGAIEHTELDDWDMVQSNGMRLIGKRLDALEEMPTLDGFRALTAGFVMRPVFEVHVQVQHNQQTGQMVWGWMVFPPWMFFTVTELPIPAGAIIEPLGTKPLALRKQLTAAVAGARQLAAQQAEVRPTSGLVALAPAGSERAIASALDLAKKGGRKL